MLKLYSNHCGIETHDNQDKYPGMTRLILIVPYWN